MFKKTNEDADNVVYVNKDEKSCSCFDIDKKHKFIDIYEVKSNMHFIGNTVTFEELEFLYNKIKELEN